MHTTLLTIAEAIKSEAGVIEHRIIKYSPDERLKLINRAKTDAARAAIMREHQYRAWPQRKIIHAPAGRTPEELYIVAHECAHVALRHDHRKPRYVREYEAEIWAHDALQKHGVDTPDVTTMSAMENVFFTISDADERGQFGRRYKRLSDEAAEWSGWNLRLDFPTPRSTLETTTEQWLRQARITDDPAGDLIADLRRDHAVKRFPNIATMRGFVRSRNVVCPQALAAVPIVWRRYRKWLGRRVELTG
jgi:hypothetical protein